MRCLRKTAFAVLSVCVVSLLAGCYDEGPLEKAGRKIDDAAEKVEHKVERAADDLK